MAGEIPLTRYSLLRKAQGGDPLAINELCEIYLPAIKRWSANTSKGRPVDADELASGSLLRFIEKTIKKFEFKPGQKLCTHLQQVIFYVCKELERAYYQDPHELANSHFFRELSAPESVEEIEQEVELELKKALLPKAIEAVRKSYSEANSSPSTFLVFELSLIHI